MCFKLNELMLVGKNFLTPFFCPENFNVLKFEQGIIKIDTAKNFEKIIVHAGNGRHPITFLMVRR
jgi:hypothetical protein